MYNIAQAKSPPKAPERAEATIELLLIGTAVTLIFDDLLKRYDTRTASSSRLYQLQRNKVMAGKRHPSKNPRSMRVTTREAKL